MSSKRQDHREIVTAKLIELLEKGTAPFQVPWDADTTNRRPFNPTTDKPYRGANSMWLSFQGYSDPRWMTYKQAEAAGWQVRKGEKSSTIEFWKFRDDRTQTDGSGKTTTISAELERPRVFHANVFNARQIDGIPPMERTARIYEWEPSVKAEEILKAANATILHDQGDRAYYSPLRDEIHLPQRDQFRGTDEYYATVFHELGHWTGHESRLNRQFGAFGDEKYAQEEFRAEIASWIMADTIGIPHNPENSAAYIKAWIKVLKEDKNEIFRASADAEAISTFVFSFGVEQNHEIEKSLSVQEINAHNLLERIARSAPANIYGDADIIADARAFLQGKPELTPEVAEILRRAVYGSDFWVDIQRDTRRLLGLPEQTESDKTKDLEKAKALDVNKGIELVTKDNVEVKSEEPVKLLSVTSEQRSALTQFIIRGGTVNDFGNSTDVGPVVQAPEAGNRVEAFGHGSNANSIVDAHSSRKGSELLNDLVVSARPQPTSTKSLSGPRSNQRSSPSVGERDDYHVEPPEDRASLLQKKASRKLQNAKEAMEL
jgi:antirestriction protein ArdC